MILHEHGPCEVVHDLDYAQADIRSSGFSVTGYGNLGTQHDSRFGQERRQAGPDRADDGQDALLACRAGAARVYTLAGYIRYAMPLTQPGILTDVEAQHIAAFINAQVRPVVADTSKDYTTGAPIDAVYYPRYPENPLRAKLNAAATPDR